MKGKMSSFGVSQKDEYRKIEESNEELDELIEERDKLDQVIEKQKILIAKKIKARQQWQKKPKAIRDEAIVFLKREICLSDKDIVNIKKSEKKHGNCPIEVGPMGRTQNTIIFSKTTAGINIKRQCGRCNSIDDISDSTSGIKEDSITSDDDWLKKTYRLSDDEAENAAEFLTGCGVTAFDEYEISFPMWAWGDCVTIRCGNIEEDISDDVRTNY